uniref:NADH-ubiquinone oxidoreductase chain 2 n=1 Tax=Panstrongylus rufotuberculatus TaxID=156443 RepID=A0A4Y5T7R2_9HEMI|nr:NADH dehydrogenase subunit 2 [Panstrongylus rufotuberculatus]QDB64196.1 NADH dehydrogenase subunit 2 [Panstrongylus rufotuberculatus]
MLNSSMILFLSTMILGTSIVVSSETWLGMWMGLEMNLISFIPLLYKSKNMASSESCMIYFLIQSLGSMLMLISVLLNSSLVISPFMGEEFMNTALLLSMMIKLGVPPFHFWFPEILEKMSWTNCSILMTWQKIAPLCVMSYIVSNPILPIIISLTVITGAVGGLNQTSLRKIMGYSSISHMGWMIACMKFNNGSWPMYLMIYSSLILMATALFNSYSSFFINQMTNSSPSLMEKSLIIIMFMSLGGLPPFIGFLPKWLVIQSMIGSNSIAIMLIMAMSSLITLFFYLRIISSTLLINSCSISWNQNKKLNSSMVMLMITINASLPVIAMLSF